MFDLVFDHARHLHRDLAVRHLDALARATGTEAVDVLALGDRYRRARGRGRRALALDLMDGGAQPPKETALRLLVIDEGFPRDFCGQAPLIHVTDGINGAFLDMGWDEPMIGLDYDGELHQTSRPRFVHDIGRNGNTRFACVQCRECRRITTVSAAETTNLVTQQSVLPRHVHRVRWCRVPRTRTAPPILRSSPGSCSDWTCTWHTVRRAVITRRTDANSESSR